MRSRPTKLLRNNSGEFGGQVLYLKDTFGIASHNAFDSLLTGNGNYTFWITAILTSTIVPRREPFV